MRTMVVWRLLRARRSCTTAVTAAAVVVVALCSTLFVHGVLAADLQCLKGCAAECLKIASDNRTSARKASGKH
eukprot:5733-Heterococcus_DN1.PRE.1